MTSSQLEESTIPISVLATDIEAQLNSQLVISVEQETAVSMTSEAVILE